MAILGAYIGLGYIEGKGNCRIYQDLDSTQHFFAIPEKRDVRLYVRRKNVQFRKDNSANQT